MRNRPVNFLTLPLAFIFAAWPLPASVIGTNVIAQSLTAERIQKQSPVKDRAAWLAYLKRSEEQMKIDRATLAAELKPGETAPPQPAEGRGAFGTGMSLRHEDAYFGTAPARHIADVIVSFQTPGGGWSKNMGFSGALRLPGQPYAANNLNAFPDPNDFDKPRDPKWNYVSTLDNDSTNTELHFLAKVQALTPGKDGDAYRASFIKGIRYLLAAQFPNGGFPQVWPLEGGYHDAITFNDNAVSESAETLSDVAEAKPGYDFVPVDLRKQAGEAAAKALKCILVSQIVINGKKTIWAQQEDALTLEPVSARNYEPGALAASESADLLEYLMSLPNPSKELIVSVDAGVSWLKAHEVFGFEYVGGRGTEGGRATTAFPRRSRSSAIATRPCTTTSTSFPWSAAMATPGTAQANRRPSTTMQPGAKLILWSNNCRESFL
jgi:PelA/Pel-15E family pectate lyase